MIYGLTPDGSLPPDHFYAANLLTKNSAGQYLPLGEWFMYRYYGSETGNVVNLTRGTKVQGAPMNCRRLVPGRLPPELHRPPAGRSSL